MSKSEVIRRGGKNIFADLDFPNAESHLLKAELMGRVQDLVAERRLTQAQTAEITGVSQPDLSRMLRGRFRDVSIERLMRMLTKLGCDVDIVVKPQRRKRAFKPIRLEAASAK
jgi:predicted XRE-type DNA-binding protein